VVPELRFARVMMSRGCSDVLESFESDEQVHAEAALHIAASPGSVTPCLDPLAKAEASVEELVSMIERGELIARPSLT
jgi:hypothetical protein